MTTTLGDSYERYTSNLFDNPLHPAGYSTILAAIGLVTRQIAVTVLLQHLSGIASALLLYAATRRLTGSAWPGLLPAGIVLLDPDFIFLEHSIMSESWFLLGISAGLYATARALDEPRPVLALAALRGSRALRRCDDSHRGAAADPRRGPRPAAVAAMVLRRPPGGYVGSAVTVLGVSIAMLLAFAAANAGFGERFGLGASPGWYLYARAAQFADCDRFTPPEGTEVLCETRPPSERLGTRYYLFDRTAPAPA